MKLDEKIVQWGRHWRDHSTLGDLCQGLFVLGETGSGKTSSLATLLRNLLNTGAGGLVLCVKSDEAETISRIVEGAGRGKDIRYIRPGRDTLNIIEESLRSADERGVEPAVLVLSEAAEVLARSKGSGSRDDFWLRAASQLLRSILTVLAADGIHTVSIERIYKGVASLPATIREAGDPDFRANSMILSLLDSRGVGSGDYAASADYINREWPSLDDRTSSSISLTLSSLLDLLRRSPLRQVLCSQTTIRPEGTRRGEIHIVDLPIKEYYEAGQVAQVVIKRLYQRAWERDAGGRAVWQWADECQFVVTPQDALFQSTARSSRVAAVYLTQNIPNLLAELGGDGLAEKRAKALVSNLTTKLYFLNSCPETNLFASDIVGKIPRRMESANSGQSLSAGSSGSVSVSSGGGWSQNMDHILRPVAFTRLRNGGVRNKLLVSAFLFQTGRRWSKGSAVLPVVFSQKPISPAAAWLRGIVR